MPSTTSHAGAPSMVTGYPELVLVEAPNGQVTGVVMQETRARSHVDFSHRHPEREDVSRGIEILRRLGVGEKYGSWEKLANLDATSLDAAVKLSPQSPTGQKFVLLYRENEWLWGIWSCLDNPVLAGLELNSVADFWGTRVSAGKRATRHELDFAIANQTFAGDYQALIATIALFRERALGGAGEEDCEAHPAIRYLCSWWNRLAPEGSREAGYFRLYIWNEMDRIFVPCEPAEPAMSAEQMAYYPSYAVFRHPEMPTICACFLRGRDFNEQDADGFTLTFTADGSEAMSIGMDLCDVDDACYCLSGLERLAAHKAFAA